MSEVTLTVGGREYTVACAEGEEDHVSRMGAQIDAKLQQLGESLSPQESQNLLFGGLLLADELHETKKQATESKSQLESRLAEVKNAEHEAKLALGQSDELKLTISRLEEELDGMQSAQQRHSAEVDDMRRELSQRREEAQAATSELETQKAVTAELERERDGLLSQIDNKDLLLDRANSHMQETRTKLEEAREAIASGSNGAPLADDPNLAPALERFANLLETCADKLEGKPPST